MPCYLHFLPEVLSAGEELVQRSLSMFHVATVLSIDQEPKEGTATCTQRQPHGRQSSKAFTAAMSYTTVHRQCEHTRTSKMHAAAVS